VNVQIRISLKKTVVGYIICFDGLLTGSRRRKKFTRKEMDYGIKGCNKNVPYLLWYIHKQGSLAILSPMKQRKINKIN